LLRLGPSTGYAVAHATRVARANTYGALEGLVSRTAALRLLGGRRYRATDPAALIAQLAAEQGEALDRLSRSLQDADRSGPKPGLSRERAVANLIMQVVARAGRRAEGVLSAALLRPTLPPGAAPRNARCSSSEAQGRCLRRQVPSSAGP